MARGALPHRPRLSGKPYSRVRVELSPNKGRDLSLPKLPIYLRSCFPVRLRGQQPARRESSASYRVSVRNLAGLGDTSVGDAHANPPTRLPSHGRSPSRSCLRLVSVSYELSIWYDDSQRNTGTEHRGFSPHKITPMLGVLQRRPRPGGFEVINLSRGPAEPGRYPTEDET